METVTAAHGPTRYDTNDHLGHESDQTLHFEDVKTPGPCRVDLTIVRVLVAIFAPDPLVTSGAECPTAVFG
jgi:hypothetical protein